MIIIRSVLTRAELEALPLDNNLKEDVAKGKVIVMMTMTMMITIPVFPFIAIYTVDSQYTNNSKQSLTLIIMGNLVLQ